MLRMKTKAPFAQSIEGKPKNNEYIEIRLPKIPLSKLSSLKSLKKLNDQKVMPVIVVLLLIAAYLLGVVTAHIQPFVK